MDEAILWIEATIGQTPQIGGNIGSYLYWGNGGDGYTAYYDQQEQLYRTEMGLGNQTPAPTIQEVLNCFGMPELYRARREPSDRRYLAVDLLYPSTGFFFSAYGSNGQSVPSIVEGSLPVGWISYVTPGTDQQMVRHIFYDRIRIDADFDKFFKQYKPWPGSLEMMEIREGD